MTFFRNYCTDFLDILQTPLSGCNSNACMVAPTTCIGLLLAASQSKQFEHSKLNIRPSQSNTNGHSAG